MDEPGEIEFAGKPATTRMPRDLLEYWAHGKGAAKIKWGVSGDFDRCRRHLRKYVPRPDMLNGLCANLHRRATGMWPGRGRRHGLDSEDRVETAAP